MADAAYDDLAAVYGWLLPEEFLTPEGTAAAFASATGDVDAGGRVLDCACGTGQLAVGLALQGFDVVATDASPAMIDRTRILASSRGVPVRAEQCRWDELTSRDWGAPFDAVFCVGNSLAHAEGVVERRGALTAIGALLRPDGVVVVTSRNWEQVRAGGSGLRLADRLVVRDGASAVVAYAWDLPEEWSAPHHVDIGVGIIGADGAIVSTVERLAFWPFRHEELEADLTAAGLHLTTTTYTRDVDRYMVTARRS